MSPWFLQTAESRTYVNEFVGQACSAVSIANMLPSISCRRFCPQMQCRLALCRQPKQKTKQNGSARGLKCHHLDLPGTQTGLKNCVTHQRCRLPPLPSLAFSNRELWITLTLTFRNMHIALDTIVLYGVLGGRAIDQDAGSARTPRGGGGKTAAVAGEKASGAGGGKNLRDPRISPNSDYV